MSNQSEHKSLKKIKSEASRRQIYGMEAYEPEQIAEEAFMPARRPVTHAQ
jgi:hypothetical protein